MVTNEGLVGITHVVNHRHPRHWAWLTAIGVALALLFATAVPVEAKRADAAGVESCAGVIAGIGGGLPGWAAAAIAAPFCGSWMGAQLARNLCWQTRQWWGYEARARVWVLTWGHYTRC
jgi:hypothetical protein